MSLLLPSSVYPPFTPDYDPRGYGVVGEGKARGSKDFVMSRSELMRFADNPWKWREGEDRPVTQAMEFGTLVDCLAFMPHFFERWYAIRPLTYPVKGMECPQCGSVTDSKTCSKCKCERNSITQASNWNLNADYCRDWENDQRKDGRTPISRDFQLEARTASARLMGDERIAELVACSQKQVLVHAEYHDKETGIVIQLKALPDLVPDAGHRDHGKCGADLKTSNDASPDKWERKVFDEEYHVQAALHLDAINAATGTERNGFYHVVIENTPPYAVGRRMLSEEFLTLGRDRYISALRLYCQCLATSNWPGYDDINDNAAQPICDGWRIVSPSSWMIA